MITEQIRKLFNFFLIKLIYLIHILMSCINLLKKCNFTKLLHKAALKKFTEEFRKSGFLISEIEKIKDLKIQRKLSLIYLKNIFTTFENQTSLYFIISLIRKDSIEALRKIKQPKSESAIKISVVMPTFNTNLIYLKEAIESVRSQIHLNWELCIADDNSTNKEIIQYLLDISKADKRIKVFFSKKKLGIANATNKAIQMASSKWIAFLDHDDLLSLDALLLIARTIKKNKKASLIYSDEDKVSSDGNKFHSPYFKPDWNYDLLLSLNYICHLLVIRKELILKVGGLSSLHNGAQDHDLILKCIEKLKPSSIYHIDKVLYHWRAHELSTATSINTKSYATEAGVRAIQDHYRRMRINAKVKALDFGYRTHYELPKKKPRVTLIIPTRNKVNILRVCISSILEKTTYPNYDIIIIDNNSDCDETLRYLNYIRTTHKNIKVIPYKKEFNYSAINNFAVKQTKSEIVGFVNNDIEVITLNWMEEMVQHIVRPDVGCVGAKLYYPNDTIQHAGVIIGLGGVAGHSHKYFPRNDYGYFGRLKLVSEFSAVTAACLFIKRDLFLKAKGFDEKNLPVAFNDIDLNLKVNALNYKNIWTPFAELYHHESASRGTEDNKAKRKRALKEIRYMKKKWHKVIGHDPSYNANLTLDHENFNLRLL